MALFQTTKESLYGLPGSVAEHRLQVQHAAEERAAMRASELAAQVSPMRDAEDRIQIWERLHALRLPRASDHVLVRVIATQTCLTVGQVHAEQRRRAEPIARPKTLAPERGAVSESEPAPAAISSVFPPR